MITYFLFYFLLLITITIFIWGIKEKDRLYSFPFLISLVYLGFVIPQVIGLFNNDNIPSAGLNLFIIVSALSLYMCYIGWNIKLKNEIRIFEWKLSVFRLKIFATLFTVIGSLFYYMLSKLPPYMIEASQYTGLPVAYLFFAHLLIYGLAISVVLFFEKKSLYALFLIVIGSFFYLSRAVSYVRRADILEIFAVFIILYWFISKRTLPRYIFMLVFLAGIFALYSTGDIRERRNYVYGFELKDVLTIDYKGNLENILSGGGTEITNAVMEIAATHISGNFDYGLYHWNMLIFNYVPAQLFGAKVKESLYLNLDYEEAQKYYRYSVPIGSTLTGFVDAFKSFWLFGVIKFFIISFILGYIYKKGKHFTVHQILYALLVTSSLHVVTHNTQSFLIPIIHIAFFLFPALYLSQMKKT